MFYTYACFFSIGCFIGFLFTMLLIRFDKEWKILIESIFCIGGSGISIFCLCDFFDIREQTQKFAATIGFILGFFFCLAITLSIMCKIIKDKNDNDIIKIGEILLGQKSYIKTYYKIKIKELNNKKLMIPELEKRAVALNEKEALLISKETYLNEQQNFVSEELKRIASIGTENLNIFLPEKHRFILSQDYIDILPICFKGVMECVTDVNSKMEEFLSFYKYNLEKFKSFLDYISKSLLSHVFNGNSTDIRIHFRYYNKGNNGYDKLIAIMGNKTLESDLTFIPYEENNMITKSYACKCSLIKSLNQDSDFCSNNYKVWEDYLTYTFYNIGEYDKPLLSFGISIKDNQRYRKFLICLNFIKFENYLQEWIEMLNEKYNIESFLYLG